MPEWMQIVGPTLGLVGVFLAAWFGFRGKKGETTVAATSAQEAAIAARWDDASELAKYIREQIEAEVERKIAPIRDELNRVRSESHEMHDAVRARETQLWIWDQRGRQGNLPMLPAPVLNKLGLGHLAATTASNQIVKE